MLKRLPKRYGTYVVLIVFGVLTCALTLHRVPESAGYFLGIVLAGLIIFLIWRLFVGLSSRSVRGAKQKYRDGKIYIGCYLSDSQISSIAGLGGYSGNWNLWWVPLVVCVSREGVSYWTGANRPIRSRELLFVPSQDVNLVSLKQCPLLFDGRKTRFIACEIQREGEIYELCFAPYRIAFFKYTRKQMMAFCSEVGEKLGAGTV